MDMFGHRRVSARGILNLDLNSINLNDKRKVSEAGWDWEGLGVGLFDDVIRP